MSDQSGASQGQNADLQFDRAEIPGGNEMKCSTCTEPITASYFKIDSKIVCARCRERAESMMSGGSGTRRFVRALVFGSIAAAIGSGIYFAVSALTGYEVGLISILVGVMVGLAVRNGSDNRGGWVYQSLAIFLTYTAIVSSYIPLIVMEIQKQNQAGMQRLAEANVSEEDDEPAGVVTASAGQPLPDGAAMPEEQNGAQPIGILDFALAFIVLFAMSYTIPFLAGFQNIIGLFIIGIGLHQAWALNKRMQSEIKGPFQVAPPTPQAAPSSV